MNKFCIFCGENPIDKNKEHVIPKWLIKYTGDQNRIATLGKKDGKEIRFSWLNYVFPSCEICNSKFAIIEDKIQVIINKLVEEKSVTHDEINLLLDWLDKIRVGIWLGQLMMHKIDVSPKFFINQRVGSRDRFCLIYRIDDLEKGIGIIGTGTSVFECSPSCFGLVINDLLFFNYSKEFLFSKNLGFPYPIDYYYDSDLNINFEKIVGGQNKITLPILEGKIIKPTIKLYQSIIKGPHGYKRPMAGIGRSFFQSNCYKYSNNLIQSLIYVSNEFDDIHRFWKQNERMTFKFKEKFNRIVLMEALTQTILEHQNHSLKESINHLAEEMDESLKNRMKQDYYADIQSNMKYINEIKDALKDIYRYI